MKKILRLIVVFISTMFLLEGCRKPEDPTVLLYCILGKIGGIKWQNEKRIMD